MKRNSPRKPNGFFAACLIAASLSLTGGCADMSHWEELFPQRPEQSTRPAPMNQPTTDNRPEYVITEPAEAPGAISPETLEHRISEYVQHFARTNATPTQSSEPERTDANRLAEVPSPQSSDPVAELAEATSPANKLTELVRRPDREDQTEEDATQQDETARALAPPVLISLSVEPDLLQGRTEHTQPAADQTGEPNRGAEVALPAGGDRVPSIVRDLEARIAANPNDLESQMRLKLLYVIQGHEQNALAPPQGLAEDAAELIRGLAEALLQTRRALTNLNLGADGALESVLAFAEQLRAYADLSISRVVLCRRVDSYGQYLPIEPPAFMPGSPVSAVVYTELQNFHSRPNEDGMYETRLTQRIEVLDETGRRLWKRQDGDIVDLCRNRRHDFFLAPIVRLPADLPPGNYRLRVEVEDLLAAKFASGIAEFTISGATPTETTTRLFGQSTQTASASIADRPTSN